MTSFGDRDFVRVFLATHLCMLSVVYSVPLTSCLWSQNINLYEQQSKRNDDEGTTVSCCAPYLICLCISNFYCVAHPCLTTNVIYIQTTVSVYNIYEQQVNLIKKRERRENCDTVRCVCYVYYIVYCTTSSISNISNIFALSLLSLGWLRPEETCQCIGEYRTTFAICCCCCKTIYLIIFCLWSEHNTGGTASSNHSK